MKHENATDVQNQRAVMAQIASYMTRVPFLGEYFWYKEFPTLLNQEGHDFDVWLWNLHIGVIEIKCREYDLRFFQKFGYMLDRKKLEYLWRMNERGFKAMFAFRCKGGEVFLTMMEHLVENRDRWEDADPDAMSTTDHGRQTRSKAFRGYNLPLDLFVQIPHDPNAHDYPIRQTRHPRSD